MAATTLRENAAAKSRRKQIDLPFSQASVLSDDQLQRLIMLQARRIPIMDWEVKMLIDSCLEKQCLDKGLAILYEYAGHVDNVSRITETRVQSARNLFQRKNGTSSDETVEQLLEILAESNLRYLIGLGNWRRLQWSPKTVLCPIITPGAMDPNEQTRVATEAALREEGRLLCQVYGSVCSRVPAHFAAILLAPYMPFEELAPMLNTPNPSSLEPAVCAIRNIISIEDDITTAYRVIRSTAKSKTSPFNDLPTLRLLYPNYEPPNTYAWFGRALDVYKSSIDILEMFRKVFFELPPFSAPHTFEVETAKPLSPSKSMAPDAAAQKVTPHVSSEVSALEAHENKIGTPPSVKGRRPKSNSIGSHNDIERPPSAPMSSPLFSQRSRAASASGMRKRTTSSDKRENGSFTSKGSKEDKRGNGSFSSKGSKEDKKGGNKSAVETGGETATTSEMAHVATKTTTVIQENDTSLVRNKDIFQASPSKTLSGGFAEPQVETTVDDWIGGGVVAGTSGAVRVASPDIKKRLNLSQSLNKNTLSQNLAHSQSANELSTKKATLLSKKTQDALTYINLTRGFMRGEARAESTALRISLAKAVIPGDKVIVMAARKIQAWWFLVGPRQHLKRRMRNFKMCKELVIDIANATILKVLKNQRQKAHLLRNGATVTITRLIKHWFYVVRKRRAPVGGWRRPGAIRSSESTQVVTSHPQLYDAAPPISASSFKRVHIVQPSSSDASHPVAASPHHKKKKRWNKLHATVVIQGFGRIILAKKKVAELRKKQAGSKKSKKKRISTYTFAKAAVILQSFFRSCLARIWVTKFIRAGAVINNVYRVHRAFKLLRSDLRRIEKPCRLTIHGVRNLPEQIFTKKNIRVKVSAYWSGLLHIFSSITELKAVVRGKKPQWTLTTQAYPVEKQLTEKELAKEQQEVLASANQSPALLSKLLGGQKQNSNQRKSMIDFQHKNIVKSKMTAVNTSIKKIKEVDSDDDSSSSSSEQSEKSMSEVSSVQSGDGKYFPSRYAGMNKKENRTLDRADDYALDMGKTKYCAAFNEEVIMLPCLHGNSILRFEFYNGDETVVFAESLYFCTQQPGLMFWGGEASCQLMYRSRSMNVAAKEAAPTMNKSRRTSIVRPEFDLMDSPPVLEMAISCGIPMMSRCGYSKVKLTSNGPMLNSMYSAFGFFHFFLNSWKKYFISLDGTLLSFFDTKHSSKAFHVIPVSELASVSVLPGKPTSVASAPFEDTHDIIIKTTHHETIYFRLSDTGNRVHWFEVLNDCKRGMPSYTLSRSDSRDSDMDNKSANSSLPVLKNHSLKSINSFAHAVGGAVSGVVGSAKDAVGNILPGAIIPGFLKGSAESDEMKKKKVRPSFIADAIVVDLNRSDGQSVSRNDSKVSGSPASVQNDNLSSENSSGKFPQIGNLRSQIPTSPDTKRFFDADKARLASSSKKACSDSDEEEEED